MPSDRDGAATVVAALAGHAAAHPDRTAFIFLADGEAVAGRLTYGGLAEAAARAARALRARVARGDRVLLVHPPGLDFVRAFLATLAAGAVAVPAPSAAPGRANRARLLAIAADCRPALAVTTPELLSDARATMAPVPATTVEALEAEDAGGPDAPPGPEFGPELAQSLARTTSPFSSTPRARPARPRASWSPTPPSWPTRR